MGKKLRSEKGYSTIKLILLVALFVAGIFVGYGIWGVQGNKEPDLKTLFQQIGSQIERIEDKNEKLKTNIKRLEEKAKKGEDVLKSLQNVQNKLSLLKAEKKQIMKKIRDYRAVYQGKDKHEGELEDFKKKVLAIPLEIETMLERLQEENERLRDLLRSIESIVKEKYASSDVSSKGSEASP